MARTRSIKPEFWSDEKLGSISRDARLTFIGLWNCSDDYGVVKGHPNWLRSQIFPYEELKKGEFEKWLTELEEVGVIVVFARNNEKYYFIKHFLRHQSINRPSSQRNPEYSEINLDGSVSAHGVLIDETETETETETLKPKNEKVRFLENVFLTQDEYGKLVKQYGQKKTDSMINNLNAYIGSKGKKYKSHYYTMLVWENKNGQEKNQPEQPVIRNAAGQPLEYIKWDDDPRNNKNAK